MMMTMMMTHYDTDDHAMSFTFHFVLQIGATVIPHRSYYRKPHHYFLLFYTGSGRHAGTTANVYCVIHSKLKKTSPIVLRDPERLLFQSGTMTSFLLTLNQSLNQITKLHLWHDISGPSPSWFLEKVVVCHLNVGVTWFFEANRWLDVSGGETVECTLEALPRSLYLNRKALFDKTFAGSFKNRHIWFSPYLLRYRTTFTRLERLATCLSVTMATVVIATIVINSTLDGDPFPNGAIKMGPLEFRVSNILWSIISSIIPISLRFLLELFFTYSEKEQQLTEEENDVQGYLDDCLRKAHQITILEGQSNLSGQSDIKLSSESLNLQDEIGIMEKQIGMNSETEYFSDNDQSLCDISLQEVGLDFNENNNSLMISPVGSFQDNEDVNNVAHIVDKGRRQDEDDTNIDDKMIDTLHKKNDFKTNSEEGSHENENHEYQLPIEEGIPNGECLNEKYLNGKEQLDEDSILSNGACIHETRNDIENVPVQNGLHEEDEEAQLNLTYTSTLPNTDKVSKLWKMLPFPHFLIDPTCVTIRNDKNTFRLQRRYFYIAVTICVSMTLISTIVSIRYGFFWSLNTTISWLMTIALALFFQVFVAESFLMFFQSVYFAIILQRPTEQNDVINEQKNKIWCKEEDDVRYYVDDVDDKSYPIPSPPTEEEVKAAREKAGQDRQLEEVLVMVAFNVLFLIQLVIIGFGNRDAESYPMRVVVEGNFNIPKFDSVSTGEQIN